MSAPGYNTCTRDITIHPSGFGILNITSIDTTTYASNTTLQVRSCRLDPSTLNYSTYQELRGGLTVDVPVTSSVPSVGIITISPVTFTGGVSTKNTYFDPISVGTTLISVGVPIGFSVPSNYRELTANVRQPDINTSPSTISVGANLQIPVTISLEDAPPSAVDVTVTVANPTIATISKDPLLAGTSSVTFTGVTGTNVGKIYVQGRTINSTTITLSAPGFATRIRDIAVQPSGFVILSPGNFTTTVNSADTKLSIYPARLDPATYAYSDAQYIRGGLTVNVPVTSSLPTVGTVTVSPIEFSANESVDYTYFHPASPGSTGITVETPQGFFTPSNYRAITATVNP